MPLLGQELLCFPKSLPFLGGQGSYKMKRKSIMRESHGATTWKRGTWPGASAGFWVGPRRGLGLLVTVTTAERSPGTRFLPPSGPPGKPDPE